MVKIPTNTRGRSLTAFLLPVIMILFILPGCRHNETKELYHRFPDGNWARFNILRFELPVTNVERPWNIYLYGWFTPAFKYDKLDFNMVMNTAAGEERVNEYSMDVRSKSGAFIGECKKDSCQGTILLKREISLNKPGVLKIEIENLTPRLNTEGVAGIGIRLVQSGK